MIYLREYSGGARQNERKTLTKKVSLGRLADQIHDPALRLAVTAFTYHPPVHLWDFGIKASEIIQSNDVVYILCEDTLYYSRVFRKFTDHRGEIGDLVEWHRIQQAPWKNPVVLDAVTVLDCLGSMVGLITNRRQLTERFFQLSS
jgi:hypothetical protein